MSAENGNYVQAQLTRSSSFYFFCCDGKEGDDFNDDIHHYTSHSRSRRDTGISFQPLEKVLYPAKEVNEHVSVSPDVFDCLEELCHNMATARISRTQTRSKAPTPAKITFAGENTCQINIRAKLPNSEA